MVIYFSSKKNYYILNQNFFLMNIDTKFITTISDKFSPPKKFHLKDYNDLSIINSISISFYFKSLDRKLIFF